MQAAAQSSLRRVHAMKKEGAGLICKPIIIDGGLGGGVGVR